jgi:hypothetical protein
MKIEGLSKNVCCLNPFNQIKIVPTLNHMKSLKTKLTSNIGMETTINGKKVWIRSAKEIIQSYFETPMTSAFIARKPEISTKIPVAPYQSNYYSKTIPMLDCFYNDNRFFKGKSFKKETKTIFKRFYF